MCGPELNNRKPWEKKDYSILDKEPKEMRFMSKIKRAVRYICDKCGYYDEVLIDE